MLNTALSTALSTAGGVQNDWVRRANRLSVYQLMLGGSTLTRAQIARATGLSIPTVTTILGEFGELELVRGVGEAEPRGGRPAQIVQLNAQARYVLSLDVSGDYARAALVDLRGRLNPLPTGPRLGSGGEAALEAWLAKLLGGLTEKSRVARIAVSVPGVVDQKSGHVRLAPALGWTDYALGEAFSRVGGVKVILENDVNALALAEKAQAAPGTFKDILFLRIDKGVGAGLFIGGELYRGAGSAAGEIGYSLLPHLGGALKLGAPGPLETYLLGLSRTFFDSSGQVELAGDAAQRAFTEFADTVGVVVHNLVCLLNPECVIVSWPADPEAHLVDYLRRFRVTPLKTEVCSSRLGDSAALRGAAQLALEDIAHTLCNAPGLERRL